MSNDPRGGRGHLTSSPERFGVKTKSLVSQIVSGELPLQVFVSSVMGDPLVDSARILTKQAIGEAPFLSSVVV